MGYKIDQTLKIQNRNYKLSFEINDAAVEYFGGDEERVKLMVDSILDRRLERLVMCLVTLFAADSKSLEFQAHFDKFLEEYMKVCGRELAKPKALN